MKSVFKTAVVAVVFAIALISSVSSAAALDRRVKIINTTGYTIVRFYGSHRDASSWQEDILGNDVLPSGSSVVINFNDGTGYCIFDFRAEFEDGDVLERYGINICEIGTYTYQ